MNHLKTILLGFLVLQGATWTDAAKAENINLPYSGRLVNADASPVDGQVDIVVEFFSSAEGGDSTSGPHVFPAVSLAEGVFQINLALSNTEFHKIFKSVGTPAWIQITDSTNGSVYDRQLLAATPYALKVPVDGSTIGWNAQGELELLKEASVTKIGGQKIVATGASSGQVLAWDSSSKEWKPTTVASASSTIAKDGNSGAGGLTLGTNDAEPLTLETNNNPAVTVTSAGNVGIGTTAPASKLTVTSNTDNNLALETYEGTYNGAALRFYKAKGTAAIPAQATNGNDLGRMTFSGHSGTSFKTAANIAVLADGNITETSSPGRIEFLTTPTASTAPTVRMTVKNDGNVGIGTTTPTAALEVNGGVRLATATAKPTCDSTKRGTIWVEQGGVGVTDTAYLCMKAAADTYSWISVTTGG